MKSTNSTSMEQIKDSHTLLPSKISSLPCQRVSKNIPIETRNVQNQFNRCTNLNISLHGTERKRKHNPYSTRVPAAHTVVSKLVLVFPPTTERPRPTVRYGTAKKNNAKTFCRGTTDEGFPYQQRSGRPALSCGGSQPPETPGKRNLPHCTAYRMAAHWLRELPASLSALYESAGSAFKNQHIKK